MELLTMATRIMQPAKSNTKNKTMEHHINDGTIDQVVILHQKGLQKIFVSGGKRFHGRLNDRIFCHYKSEALCRAKVKGLLLGKLLQRRAYLLQRTGYVLLHIHLKT